MTIEPCIVPLSPSHDCCNNCAISCTCNQWNGSKGIKNLRPVLQLSQVACLTTTSTFMETHLGFCDAANVEIQRVHRVGKKKDDKPRTIIARFLRFKDVEKLLSLGHQLRGTNYKVYQDLPLEIVQRRKKLMDAFKKARRNNIPAAFSKSQPEKLFIRGKLWPSGMPFEL